MATISPDKIHLYTDDFKLSTKIKKKTTTSKVYHSNNKEIERVELKVDAPFTVFLEAIDEKTRIYVNFNPSVILFGNNFKKPTNEEFINSINIVKSKLKECGIFVTDFDSMNVSRLDIAKDMCFDCHYDEITPIFDFMSGTHLKQMKYQNTYYLQNSGLKFSFYDKSKQMKKKGGEIYE